MVIISWYLAKEYLKGKSCFISLFIYLNTLSMLI